jgi:hypothetical protein
LIDAENGELGSTCRVLGAAYWMLCTGTRGTLARFMPLAEPLDGRQRLLLGK